MSGPGNVGPVVQPHPEIQVHPQVMQQQQPLAPPLPGVQHVLPPHGLGGGIQGFPGGHGVLPSQDWLLCKGLFVMMNDYLVCGNDFKCLNS